MGDALLEGILANGCERLQSLGQFRRELQQQVLYGFRFLDFSKPLLGSSRFLLEL